MQAGWRKRMVYGAEALVIGLVIAVGAFFPTLLTVLAVALVPAFGFAVISLARPSYLDRGDLQDLRSGRRLYLHACASLCLLVILWMAVSTIVALRDGSLQIIREPHSSLVGEALPNPTLQLTASSLALGTRS